MFSSIRWQHNFIDFPFVLAHIYLLRIIERTFHCLSMSCPPKAIANNTKFPIYSIDFFLLSDVTNKANSYPFEKKPFYRYLQCLLLFICFIYWKENHCSLCPKTVQNGNLRVFCCVRFITFHSRNNHVRSMYNPTLLHNYTTLLTYSLVRFLEESLIAKIYHTCIREYDSRGVFGLRDPQKDVLESRWEMQKSVLFRDKGRK